MLGNIRHLNPSEYGWVHRVGDIRIRLAGLVVVLAVAAEVWTVVPGLRLLLVAVVIYAPAFLFVRFWKGLAWLREGNNLDELLARRHRREWRGWKLLWVAFGVVWLLDLIATVWFFFVPTLSELHPITVFLYQTAGIPGVVFAGTAYAVLVVLIVHELPKPRDFDFLAAATVWYGILVVHNYVLLLG
jgi:hypothetical protein